MQKKFDSSKKSKSNYSCVYTIYSFLTSICKICQSSGPKRNIVSHWGYHMMKVDECLCGSHTWGSKISEAQDPSSNNLMMDVYMENTVFSWEGPP